MKQISIPRTTAILAGLAALIAPLGVAPPAASAAPPAAPAIEAQALGVQYVTLVTGDRVALTRSGPGGYEVDVEPAPRGHGTAVSFFTQAGPDGVYVLPSDAMPAVQAGRLDRELFHVSYLVEQGYADADTGELPVIVTYRRPAARGAAPDAAAPDADTLAGRTDRLPGTAGAVGLASINGAAAEVAKDQAGEFWQGVTGTPAAARGADLTGGVAGVWLDRTAELVLDESVPLIGAPQAWDAGFDGTGVRVAVLDSGVDLNHPDLAGQIAAAESFVDGLPPQDGHGHGTHVASTIAGTGAASGGRYTGVAPGAELVSGRVCTDSGNCPFSSMIAGMEWAAGPMDADVVSMSISGGPSDGTDPLSQAINSLTDSTGALFVVAAGNEGRDVSVGTPGTADAALAVAATDKSDQLASFSSRGPRFGDMALKPDIAAPGVDIVAARAEGTAMGRPVDESYTAADGTSMATPHVSGTAAILAQRYPEWTPEQLKAGLMSTAADAGHTVYEQGAGRVDIGRAATQQVFATTASLDFGSVTIPPAGEPEPGPVTREVTYRNLSGAPVTLTLAATLRTTAGEPVPAGALVADPSVTVPAGGTATAAVTLDTASLPEGTYTGAVVATSEAGRVTTPVGLVREPHKYTLTVRTLGRDGQPYSPWAQETLRLDGPGGRIPEVALLDEGLTAVRVPAGTYSVTQAVDWVDGESRANSAMLSQPELVVTQDTEITLDLRQADQIRFTTPRTAAPLNNNTDMAYQRSTTDGQTFAGVVSTMSSTRLWATPTGEVSTGRFRFWTQALLGEPEVTLAVRRPGHGPTLHPVSPHHWSYPMQDGSGGEQLTQNGHPGWVPFTGTKDRTLVDVGGGSAEELAGLDLTGKLALVAGDAAFIGPLGRQCGIDIDRMRLVRDAGAAGIVAYPAPDHPCGLLSIPLEVVQEQFTGPKRELGIPNVYLSTEEGLALRELLARERVTLRVKGQPETDYSYVLKPYEEGRIPDSLHYRFTRHELAEVELDYHTPRFTTFVEHRVVWKPDDAVKQPLGLADHGAPGFTGPRTRTEYFGPVSDQVLHARTIFGRQGGLEPEGYTNRMYRNSFPELFVAPEREWQEWFLAPKSIGERTASDEVHALVGPDALQSLGDCAFCRQNGVLFTLFPMVTGGPDNRQTDAGGTPSVVIEEVYFDFDIRLFRDGTEIPPMPGLPWEVFPMPEQAGQYRLTADGPQTHAAWTFGSEEPTVDTRQQGYRCIMELFPGPDGPCAPQPMVFVSYDLAGTLATDNSVRAPGVHRFRVHAYHPPSTVPMPRIAGLELSVSYDGGEHWTPARVRDRGNGEYDVTVLHPPQRHRDSDSVALRVEAWDEAGNRLEQTTLDAFTLDERRHWDGGPSPF